MALYRPTRKSPSQSLFLFFSPFPPGGESPWRTDRLVAPTHRRRPTYIYHRQPADVAMRRRRRRRRASHRDIKKQSLKWICNCRAKKCTLTTAVGPRDRLSFSFFFLTLSSPERKGDVSKGVQELVEQRGLRVCQAERFQVAFGRRVDGLAQRLVVETRVRHAARERMGQV